MSFSAITTSNPATTYRTRINEIIALIDCRATATAGTAQGSAGASYLQWGTVTEATSGKFSRTTYSAVANAGLQVTDAGQYEMCVVIGKGSNSTAVLSIAVGGTTVFDGQLKAADNRTPVCFSVAASASDVITAYITTGGTDRGQIVSAAVRRVG